MSYRFRYCCAAFAGAMILLFVMCGFALVDLSADKYMPGQFAMLLEVDSVDESGVVLTLLGERYVFSADALSDALSALHRFRGLVPARNHLARRLALAVWDRAGALADGIWPLRPAG